MNKHLKFRTWDGKRFHEWGYLRVSCFIEKAITEEDYLCFVSPPNAKCPSQQFSGLLDRTGKEIYEGDLYITGSMRNVRQVYYHSGTFCGGMSLEESTPLNWHYDEEEDNLLIDNFSSRIEVIGNIFENPELIEELL